jgi:SAM-dependent methyltransferase
MDWMNQLSGLLQQYGGGAASAQQTPANVDNDFDRFAQAAPNSAIADGLAAAFRSEQTPEFGQMVSQLFNNSNGQQRASLLNTLIATVGPTLVAQLLSRRGTGLLTIALLKALARASHITALDLSTSSIITARRAVAETSNTKHQISFLQANVLNLPFGDGHFDFIVTSGALEYVPLDEGMSELARVLAPGGYFLHLPVHPSPTTSMLEWMFHFKSHSPHEVMENTMRYFRVVDHHRFPILDPISWSKTAVLAQKA